MSAPTIRELEQLVKQRCGTSYPETESALLEGIRELAELRAAKSEHKRTRREIRKLSKFVQWSPESIVEAKRKLVDDNRELASRLDVRTRENTELLRANEKLTHTNRDQVKQLSDLCDANARLVNKVNALEDANKLLAQRLEAEGKEAAQLRARANEAQSATVALAEQCDELRKGKVLTNADVCAVDELAAMKADLFESEENRAMLGLQLAQAHKGREDAIDQARNLRNDNASLSRSLDVYARRLQALEKVNSERGASLTELQKKYAEAIAENERGVAINGKLNNRVYEIGEALGIGGLCLHEKVLERIVELRGKS